MNFEKNERQARKLAKEQARLRKIARQNPDRLKGKDRAKVEREITFENYEEREVEVQPRERYA